MSHRSGREVPSHWWQRASGISVTSHLWLMMAVVVAMVVASLVALTLVERSDIYDRAEDRAGAVAAKAGDALDRGFMELDELAQSVSADDQAPLVAAGDAAREQCELSSGGLGVGLPLEIHIVDAAGTVVCSSDPAAEGRTGYVDVPWFASLDDPGLVGSYHDPVLGHEAAAVVIPIVDPGSGTWVGVMMGVIDPVPVPESLAAVANADDHAFVVVDDSGTIVSAPEVDSPPTFTHHEVAGRWDDLSGVEHVWARAEVPSVGWIVYAGRPASAVAAEANGALLARSVLGLVAVAILALLTWALQRRIARPLQRLTEAVKRGGHELDPERVPVEGPAEIRQLGGEYNEMIRARLEYESRLTHQALHDPLTDLPNRTLLLDRLGQALERSRRSGQKVGLLFLDVDRFKVVNDSLGHSFGDEVLLAITERLRSSIRPGDTVARFGGDEFVVLCDGLRDADEAAQIAERIREDLTLPMQLNGQEVRLTASVGITVAEPDNLPAPEDMLRDADAAMYEAKQRGRDAYEIFDADLRARAASRLELERELRLAIERNELELHYQPIVSLDDERVVAAEALVRWNHPLRGQVLPLSFIPVAEESGLIVPIGRFVLEEACRQQVRWVERGHRIRVAVNVSPHQLRRNDFVDTVARAVHTSGMEPGSLCLEITESTLIDERGPALHALTELREIGVRISVDDFGTGYSSLGRLRDLPVDELKIDRTFVADLLNGRQHGSAFLAAIITMGHSLGLEAVAEGIERSDQLAWVREQDCDLAQGFHFARPMAAADATAFLGRAMGVSRVTKVPNGN